MQVRIKLPASPAADQPNLEGLHLEVWEQPGLKLVASAPLQEAFLSNMP